jgi:hypothetical protein
VHRIAAQTLLAGPIGDLAKADVGFLHALMGKSDDSLMKLAYGVVRANQHQRKLMAEWITGLRIHRKDRPVYHEKPFLSVLLRFAQLLLISGSTEAKPDDIQRC